MVVLADAEIVCQSDPVTTGNFEHLVFAVAVECSPLNTAAADTASAPIKRDRSGRMANKQLATGMSSRKTDNQ